MEDTQVKRVRTKRMRVGMEKEFQSNGLLESEKTGHLIESVGRVIRH